ncbi:GntR family transcriptional regulator [Paroceanicella profunda]|uniref:GntR family transcriptional regulator n=1 Tax=Paroceanicella profunda TaxID=2579971 RepID=A0A5B8FYT3_9RHOB|nr:GntR family transcriptional regulator [Paroceanicella profunda]QDL91353.1 GntR family transcriptional regulator [Paroceanicella profunda]
MYDRSSPFVARPAAPGTLPGTASKSEFAVDRLRDAILTCALAPSQMVSEQDLTERFGLNRAATRAALARLSGEGLVLALPRRGWQVAPVTAELVGGLIAARRVLEPALAPLSRTAETRAALSAVAEVCRALAGRTDPGAPEALRGYDRELLGHLAAPANAWMRGWLAQAWDNSDRMLRHLEAGSGLRHPTPDRHALALAVAREDAHAIVAELLAALDAFEAFAGRALLAGALDPAAGARPARPAPSTDPHRTGAQDAQPRRPSPTQQEGKTDQ